MKKTLENYFTTGELAKACHILRKTLLYYDKLGLIQPEVILDNGYRYYKRAQLFLLELVITLRNLDVPLISIQKYLANRSPVNYRHLLLEQQVHIQQEIQRLQQLNDKLGSYLAELDKLSTINYGHIKLVEQPEQYYFVVKGCRDSESFKERSLHAAKLFLALRDALPFKQHFFGYIVNTQALFNQEHFYGQEFFDPLPEPLPNLKYRVRPAGKYLTLYFQGTYMHNSTENLKKLGQYCLEHNLKPLSDIYVTSLLNYWTTAETQEYAYKLEIRIQ